MVSGAIRRYFRLSGPIILTVILAYVIHRNQLFFNDRVAELNSNSWLARFYKFDPSAFLVLKEGLYAAILNYDPAYTYDSVLWTMEVEFVGSLFVFSFLYVFGTSICRPFAYCAVFLVLFFTERVYTMDFLFGMILCDLLVNKDRFFRLPLSLSVLVVGLGLFLGGLRQEWLALPGAPLWDSIGAVLVIIGITANGKMRFFLETRTFAFLGRVSFGTYLVHWPVLMSLGCGLYLLLRNIGFEHDASALFAGLGYVLVTIFLAWLLYHCADRPAIWLGHAVYGQLRRFARPAGVSATAR